AKDEPGHVIGDSGRRELARFLHLSLMRLDPINGVERAMVELTKPLYGAPRLAVAQIPHADIAVRATIHRDHWIARTTGQPDCTPDRAASLRANKIIHASFLSVCSSFHAWPHRPNTGVGAGGLAANQAAMPTAKTRSSCWPPRASHELRPAAETYLRK